MLRRISLRLALAILTGAVAFPLIASAQSSQDAQTQSVADAARRAREKKKAADKQPAPVITDDTLKPSAPRSQEGDASVPAPVASSEAAPGPKAATAAQPSADSANAAAGSAASASDDQRSSAAGAGEAAQKAQQASAELAALKQQVADGQKGLELLQRDLALQQDTYFSNPDHSHDTAGKAKLDAMQQQVGDKQQEVNALKAKLAELQATSGSAAPAAPSTPPQS